MMCALSRKNPAVCAEGSVVYHSAGICTPINMTLIAGSERAVMISWDG